VTPTARLPSPVHHGQHVCLIYDDPKDQLPTLLPFIEEGLQRGEQCIYIVDDIEGVLLRNSLERAGLDVARAEQTGALLLWTRAEWRQPGELDSGRKSAQVASILKRARAAGFAGVRLAVEMTWTLNPRIPVERLRHWEATLDTLLAAPGHTVSVICQYSRRRLAPAALESGLSTHRHAIVDGEIYSNPYFEGPAILASQGRHHARVVRSREVARMISSLQREKTGASLEQHVWEPLRTTPSRQELQSDAPLDGNTRAEAISLISHELRTPVSTILGNAELLARLDGALSGEERAASVAAILAETRRLGGVLDDLFVLWQGVAARELVLEPLSLRHTIERRLEVHRQRHPERNVDFTANSAELTVAADHDYVVQILSNLLENAERYSPVSDRILVETALEGDYMGVRIVDQGPEVVASERDLIFKAFIPQAAGLRRGFGAGLAASKRLVEAQGGQIWTQPSARGGTEFGFTLPLATEGDRDGQ